MKILIKKKETKKKKKKKKKHNRERLQKKTSNQNNTRATFNLRAFLLTQLSIHFTSIYLSFFYFNHSCQVVESTGGFICIYFFN